MRPPLQQPVSPAIFEHLLEVITEKDDSAPRTTPEVWAKAALGFTATAEQSGALNYNGQRLILCCNRQWGKTTIAAIKALYEALAVPGTEIVVLSKSVKHAAKLLDVVSRYAANLQLSRKRVEGRDVSVQLPNTSKIYAIANTTDAARGFTANILIVDEAAFLTDDVLGAAIGSLSRTDGKLWLLSVPNGRTGLFYHVWHKRSLQEWHRVYATIATAPHATPAYIAELKSLFPLNFRRDFYCDFLHDRRRLLTPEEVDRMVDPTLICPPLPSVRAEALKLLRAKRQPLRTRLSLAPVRSNTATRDTAGLPSAHPGTKAEPHPSEVRTTIGTSGDNTKSAATAESQSAEATGTNGDTAGLPSAHPGIKAEAHPAEVRTTIGTNCDTAKLPQTKTAASRDAQPAAPTGPQAEPRPAKEAL